ncbi:MAG: hypothetical protein M5R42_08385 [Rhodocyclaceae bacterium]|nr:hypothetical protein [Rhodocyclaceae bacterium]
MLQVGGLEDHGAFVRLVDGVLLGDLHGGEISPLSGSSSATSEPVLMPSATTSSVDSVMGIGQEQAVGHFHAVAHAPPVAVRRHEAVERREAADAQHDDVALLAQADLDFRQRLRACQFGLERLALQQQGPQCAPAVRIDQCH